jgi:hypothetical protein
MFEITKNKENNSIQMKVFDLSLLVVFFASPLILLASTALFSLVLFLIQGFCLQEDKKLYTFEKTATLVRCSPFFVFFPGSVVFIPSQSFFVQVKDKVNEYNVEKVKAQVDGQDAMKDDKNETKKAVVWRILNAGADHIAVQNTENKNVFVLARTSKIPELKAHMDKLPLLASQFGIKELKLSDQATCKDLESKMGASSNKSTEASKESSASTGDEGMVEEGDDGMSEEGRRERREKIRKQLDLPMSQRLFLVATAEVAFHTCKCPTLDLKLRSKRVKTMKAVDFRVSFFLFRALFVIQTI